MPDIAFVRIQRYHTPDLQTYAAVRRDELVATLAASDRVVTMQECELDLPERTMRELTARLAAPVRPVQALIGDVTGDAWATGPLEGRRRPLPWRRLSSPANGYRCGYHSPDGRQCDMIGEGTGRCPAHQPGTRWRALPALDDDDDDDQDDDL